MRLEAAEREFAGQVEFLVRVLSSLQEQPETLEERLTTLESQFMEGLKLVVRIRALRDAQRRQ